MDSVNSDDAQISREEYRLKNADDQILSCKKWFIKGRKPKAIVFLVHGFCEHLFYYDQLGVDLAKEGFLVAGHDHVGHGRSEGTRVHVSSVGIYVRDVYQHTDKLKEAHPEVPIFLVGHSMGGTISIKAAFIKPKYFKGIVLIAPCVVLDPELASPFKKAIARMLGRIYPQFPVAPLDDEYLTRNQECKRIMLEDPLRFRGYAKAGWSCAMLDALEDIEKNMDTVTWPYLLLHGSDDRICSLKGSQLLHKKAPSNDKTIKVYQNAYHTLLMEYDDVSKEVRRETVKWIEARCG